MSRDIKALASLERAGAALITAKFQKSELVLSTASVPAIPYEWPLG